MFGRFVSGRGASATAGGDAVLWQIVLGVFLVALPFALLSDLHPDRERLDASGRPLRRDWR